MSYRGDPVRFVTKLLRHPGARRDCRRCARVSDSYQWTTGWGLGTREPGCTRYREDRIRTPDVRNCARPSTTALILMELKPSGRWTVNIAGSKTTTDGNEDQEPGSASCQDGEGISKKVRSPAALGENWHIALAWRRVCQLHIDFAQANPSSRLGRFVWYNLNHGTWTDVPGCGSPASSIDGKISRCLCCPFIAEIG
jgi:hypothetical protein